MGDLISREAVLKLLRSMRDIEGFGEGFGEGIDLAVAIVEVMQAVDAEPVRHGRWIVHDRAEECNGVLISNYECSECCSWERHETDYCPNCGAKMDAEAEK